MSLPWLKILPSVLITVLWINSKPILGTNKASLTSFCHLALSCFSLLSDCGDSDLSFINTLFWNTAETCHIVFLLGEQSLFLKFSWLSPCPPAKVSPGGSFPGMSLRSFLSCLYFIPDMLSRHLGQGLGVHLLDNSRSLIDRKHHDEKDCVPIFLFMSLWCLR